MTAEDQAVAAELDPPSPTAELPAAERLRPYGERILLRPIPHPTELRSGLILPELALPRPDRGVVLAVGPGVTSPMGVRLPVEDVRAGDTVLFIRHGGYVVEVPPGVDDEELLLITPREIVAVEVGAVERAAKGAGFCDGCGVPLAYCTSRGGGCCPACSHDVASVVAGPTPPRPMQSW